MSDSKRRKLRKGTHSCWQCKRRKMKCIFDPLDSDVCNGCQRRGSECVSQEFNEEPSSEDGRRAYYSSNTIDSKNSEVSPYLRFYEYPKYGMVESGVLQTVSAPERKLEQLSRFLHEQLPSRETMGKLFTAAGPSSALTHELLTLPYATLYQNGLKMSEILLQTPERNMHPVLIARYMLQLAIFLQHLDPSLHKEMESLSEPPRAMMERLAHLAINLVTTSDELLGSIEGVECVMIESLYQMNIGSVRRSWVACRRAMSVAQLMGLHRPDHEAQYKVLDPETKYDSNFMWLRIVTMDRHLCLMLGLPQGCFDRGMASEATLMTDTPMGRLERIHCVIASKILERNESTPSSRDLNLTRDLDMELQRAARTLPSKWWLLPDLNPASSESQTLFWDTRRLFLQVLHYNLLNQLHLPYMLRSPSVDNKYEYSRMACVNASREVLSRFITLRSFNRTAYSCRTIDFLALMAAMTLLLAHLTGHQSEMDCLLAHQYLSDRAMIEKVQENMEEVNRLNSDALSAQSADVLRRLLHVDVEIPRSSRTVSVQEKEIETAQRDQEEDVIVSVHIPYFGIIKIVRDGISQETSRQQATATTTGRPAQARREERSSATGAKDFCKQPQTGPFGLFGLDGISSGEVKESVEAGYNQGEVSPMMLQGVPEAYAEIQQQRFYPSPASGADDMTTHFVPQLEDVLSNPLVQYGELPGVAAGGEDWAFQGVDTAFFDSLMRRDIDGAG